MTNSERVIVADMQAVAECAAEYAAGVLREAVVARGRARIVLTGGSSGIATAAALRHSEVPWEQVDVYFGDERFVPTGDSDRNDVALEAALLAHVRPRAVVGFPALDGRFGADVNAAAIESGRALAALESLDETGLLFDVHLLGMGGEGHINSLFPHTEATAEEYHLVMPVTKCSKPPATRITLTFPAIRRSAHVVLVVAGTDKAAAVSAAAQPDTHRETLPVVGACGREKTLWVLDEAAASRLLAEAD